MTQSALAAAIEKLPERERCPTCNQPIGPWKPTKVCGVCQKPIRKGHKWQIDGSMIRHRVCDEPESYGKKP